MTSSCHSRSKSGQRLPSLRRDLGRRDEDELGTEDLFGDGHLLVRILLAPPLLLRPAVPIASATMVVRELELDLDAFEGPFDLLLTLVLREELDLAEIDVAAIVVAFIERLAEREELDLEACGEFLVLVAALLELKARALFPDEEAELADLGPEEAAEELARRLAEYRRMKEAAAWLSERLGETRDRFFRLGPAPLAPQPDRKLAPQEAESLAAALRALAVAPPQVSLSHMALRFPPVTLFLERFRALLRPAPPLRLRPGSGRHVARRGRGRLPRPARAAQAGRDRHPASCPVRADKDRARRRRKEPLMERPLRLIAANPLDALARVVEALLVVASAPLSTDELCEAADESAERVETALGLLAERYREGRSGIVLEQVAGGWAFRASRDAADACARLFERPVQRGLSQAALETVAIVAYLGPVSRPEIARIRGVAADSAVAGLVERGLIAEAGRDDGAGGAVRYRTTPLFERVFGLESLSALPRLDDLGADAEQIRERLAGVAEQRTA